jgi:signal transduction histidine kinase
MAADAGDQAGWLQGVPRTVVMPLKDGLQMAVTGCECQDASTSPNLLERARMAQIIVASFQTSLSRELEGGWTQQFSRILGAIGTAVFLVDQSLNIAYANQTACELTRSQPLNLIGKPLSRFGGPWLDDIMTRTDKATYGEMDIFEAAGNRYRVNWQVAPLEGDGDSPGWLLLVENKTEYYQRLEAARKAERLAATATMVGALAHEIRNPLTSATGLLQLLGTIRKSDTIKGYIDLIMHEMERVTKLLNEFLLLGRPVEMLPEPIDLTRFLKELQPSLAGETRGSRIRIEFMLQEVNSILGDPEQLTQVLVNLVRNAITAVDGEGLVQVNLSEEPEGVVISVQDDGPGISPQVGDNIFQPFFTTKELGTGLGLTVVQTIVHNHGGRVTADNAPDGGAVFRVVLPVYPPGSQERRVDAILVITDDILRFTAEHALRSVGVRCLSLGGRDEFISLTIRAKPRVFVISENLWGTFTAEVTRNHCSGFALVVLGDSPGLPPNDAVNGFFVCPPSDYVRLIGCVYRAFNLFPSSGPTS